MTNLAPGMAETEFSEVRFKGDSEKAGKVYNDTEPLRPEDIADIVFYTATLPEHINLNAIEVMSINQSWGPLAVHRKKQNG